MSAPLVVEFPKGIPVHSHLFGSRTHTRGTVPGMFVHHDWDLFYIEEGHGSWELKDGTVLKVPAHHFFLLPPLLPAWSRTFKFPFRLWYCHFSFHPIPNDFVFLPIRKDCMERDKRVMIPLIFSKEQAPEVWKDYQDLISIDMLSDGPPWRAQVALTRMVSELGAFALRINIPDQGESLPDVISRQDHRVLNVCRQIRENPTFPWKVSELAKSVHLSVGHLDTLWRAYMKTNLKSYIVENRLRHAATLLNHPMKNPNSSIKEISSACGFSSQQFFSSQFKRFFGASPSQYQRMN